VVNIKLRECFKCEADFDFYLYKVKTSSTVLLATVCRTPKSTMRALSSTVLSTSDPNYQAMLTTEPLNPANIVDSSANLSKLLPLTTSRTATPTRRTPTFAAPVDRYGTARTPRIPSTGTPGPASPTSCYICTRPLCTARMYGHTHGWHVAIWQGSGESRLIGRCKNRSSPSLLRDRIVLPLATSRPRVPEFQTRYAIVFVCKIIRLSRLATVESTHNRQGQSSSIFTMFSLGLCGSRKTDQEKYISL
jgi:hypothetical protein